VKRVVKNDFADMKLSWRTRWKKMMRILQINYRKREIFTFKRNRNSRRQNGRITVLNLKSLNILVER